MVVLVHDLEMRGRKLHLIHNYEAQRGGTGERGEDASENLYKCSEKENSRIPTNPSLKGEYKHNIKYSEAFKRTLAFVQPQ